MPNPGELQKRQNERKRKLEGRAAVSETLSTGLYQLGGLEQVDQDTMSPVMKNMRKVPVQPDVAAPDDQEVSKAHDAAELSMPMKRSRRIRKSNAKHERQTLLGYMQVNYQSKRAANHLAALGDNALETLNAMDLSSLMTRSGAGDEYLAEHYDTLKDTFAYIPEYEAKLKELQEKDNPSEEDSELALKTEAKLMALKDVRAYYDIQEALMQNRYYALLPRDEMKALSANELRIRLAALYEKPAGQRNMDLIDFYQNLFRLKELGLSDKKSIKAREKEYTARLSEEEDEEEQERDPQQEMEVISLAFFRLNNILNDPACILSAGEKEKRIAQFFEKTGKDIEDLTDGLTKRTEKIQTLIDEHNKYLTEVAAHTTYTAKDTADLIDAKLPAGETAVERRSTSAPGIVISPDQLEAMRKIQSLLLTRAVSDVSDSKLAFVSRLLEAPPEQQLLVFYLVENEKAEQNVPGDFYSALNHYTPDLGEFRKNLKWDAVSLAVQSAKKAGAYMQSFGALEQEIETSSSQLDQDDLRIENASQPLLTAQARRTVIIETVAKRGAMLRLLYKSAGMHEDMPPDMAQDEHLRARMYEEYREIARLFKELVAISQQFPLNQAPDYAHHQHAGADPELAEDEEEESATDGIFDKAEKINEYGGYALEEDDLFMAIGKYASDISDSAVYGGITYGLSVVSGLISMATTIYGAVKLGGTAVKAGLTTADQAGQWIGLIGDFIGGAADTTAGASWFLQAIGVLDSAENEAAPWIGDLSTTFWNGTEFAGETMLLYAGGAMMIAGTIQTIAGSVQLGRAFSSHNDVNRSKETLENKGIKNLSPEERQLYRFVRHQERAVSQQEDSAMVDMVSGLLTIAGGVIVSSGILAPIGGILGLIGAGIEIGYKFIGRSEKRRNQVKAVDDFLEMPKMKKHILDNHPEKARLKNIPKEKLEKQIREEALAELGFATTKECFRHVMKEHASLLYRKVFDMTLPQAEKEPYLDAMKSLGMKIVMPDANHPEVKPQPTVGAMLAKLMD